MKLPECNNNTHNDILIFIHYFMTDLIKYSLGIIIIIQFLLYLLKG